MKKMGTFVQLSCLLKKISQLLFKCFAQARTNFLLLSAENTKKSHVLHFNNQNSVSKHDFYNFKHFNPIFYLHSEFHRLVYLIFAFQKLQNSISAVPHLPYVLVCKTHIYLPMMTL